MKDVRMIEKSEVMFTVKAIVPKKYVPFMCAMMAQNPDLFQIVADEWIKDVRIQSAKAGVEVDDVIAAAIADENPL